MTLEFHPLAGQELTEAPSFYEARAVGLGADFLDHVEGLVGNPRIPWASSARPDMSERWSIYIDIEGFSALWDMEARVLSSLGELMRSIFLIGRQCYDQLPSWTERSE